VKSVVVKGVGDIGCGGPDLASKPTMRLSAETSPRATTVATLKDRATASKSCELVSSEGLCLWKESVCVIFFRGMKLCGNF
jgi:hypothetical protein